MRMAEQNSVQATPSFLKRLWRSSRGVVHQRPAGADSLAECARLSADDTLARLRSAACGLAADEAGRRLRVAGPNRVIHEARHTLIGELVNRTINPLNLLLLSLAAASYALGD